MNIGLIWLQRHKIKTSSDERDREPAQLGKAATAWQCCGRLPWHRPVAGYPAAALSSLGMSGESVKT